MLKDSHYQEESATINAKTRSLSSNDVSRNQECVLRPDVKDHSDSDDDASDEQDEEDDEEDDDDIVSLAPDRVPVRAYGFRAKYPLTSMPAERPDHKFFQAKYYKTLEHFKKLTTEPETYYLAKKPCTLCFGKWPCIMKKGAPKCRVCDGEACSFYDPKAVQTEPESSKSKTTSHKTDHKKPKASKPSSSKATSSKRQLSELSELSELSYVDPSPVKPQKKTISRNELATAREVVVIDVEDEESDEEQISHKTDHEKTKVTKPSSSRTTSSKRQLPDSLELSDLDSSPVKPQKKSRIESAPVRKEVVDDDEDEESDEEKYEHNSRTCRRLLDKLESQKWYKRLEGKGHCLSDLVEMEKLHWRSIDGPKGRRFVEVN